MSFWRWISGRSEPEREPTPRQNLEAHVRALLERCSDAEDSVAGKLSLSVVQDASRPLLAIETRLTRIEAVVDGGEVELRLLPDSFFPGATELTEVKARLLSDWGFGRADSGCFTLKAGRDSVAVAERVERALVELLDHDPGSHYAVAIEPERVPDNSELIRSIEHLVKVQDLDARRLVYQAFLNAQLYVPLSLPDDVNSPADIRPWHRPGFVDKGEDWAVFSDRDALRRVHGPSASAALASGIRIVRAAEARGIAALGVNPKSRIGGEFLRNELWMMGDYLRKLGVV